MRRVFLLLTMFALILIFSDRVFRLDFLRDVPLRVFAPIEYGLLQTGRSVGRMFNFVASIPFVYQENQKLKSDLEGFLVAKVESERLKKENLALRKQLKIQGISDRRQIMARVLGTKTGGGMVGLIIDHGTKDGLREGDVASVDRILIGRVVQTSNYQSVVETVFSSRARIPAKVGDEVHGLVMGEFGYQIRLTEVLQEAALKTGDVVVTSGAGGGYFPPDLILGTVEEVQAEDSNVFKTAVLKPAWGLSEVSVLFFDSQ